VSSGALNLAEPINLTFPGDRVVSSDTGSETPIWGTRGPEPQTGAKAKLEFPQLYRLAL